MGSLSHLVDVIIKPELEGFFGPAMTSRIIMTARAKSNAPIVGMTKDHFEKLIDAIIIDDRVQGLLGPSGAHDRKKQWEKALKSFEAS